MATFQTEFWVKGLEIPKTSISPKDIAARDALVSLEALERSSDPQRLFVCSCADSSEHQDDNTSSDTLSHRNCSPKTLSRKRLIHRLFMQLSQHEPTSPPPKDRATGLGLSIANVLRSSKRGHRSKPVFSRDDSDSPSTATTTATTTASSSSLSSLSPSPVSSAPVSLSSSPTSPTGRVRMTLGGPSVHAPRPMVDSRNASPERALARPDSPTHHHRACQNQSHQQRPESPPQRDGHGFQDSHELDHPGRADSPHHPEQRHPPHTDGVNKAIAKLLLVPQTLHPKTKKPSVDEPACTLHEKYGDCMVTGVLGRGATACVRLVVVKEQTGDAVVEKLLAIKKFRKKRRDESLKEYIKKRTSEFCISSSLHHINIVETLDLVIDEDHDWCEVMEYCSGGTLFDVLQEYKFKSQDISCCFKQLMEGVRYLHSMGVAHRDLKPENLYFDGQGNLKIGDFGVSEVFQTVFEQSPHLSKGLCGSAPYIAPEEFMGLEYDPREVDVWACGIIYYTMIYMNFPWAHATDDDSRYQKFLRSRNGQYAPIDGLPDECSSVLNQILEPDPRLRITVSGILATSWYQGMQVCSMHHHVCKKKLLKRHARRELPK
ncbi:kinase-like domain-containing protein [Polychytrium aggregatum]|uniref:kinase-like domain-containing protein n=1 Tax=Polychytrium aggregatum TaxID=110093 RepID=UPI0022FDD95E|nr:kinase-like domain-containing protein [Polychytrium aggregatum]KAI9206207.1 kinase-like domain-containing protein [Polychytrium aggregatum]